MLTDAATKARIGQIADLKEAQQMADLGAREQALISGHADLEFSGFVTVTAATGPTWMFGPLAPTRRRGRPAVGGTLRGAAIRSACTGGADRCTDQRRHHPRRN